MSYQIKHLQLGGVLDQAITITKDHFGLLIKIMAIVFIPANLIMALVGASILPQPPGMGATDEQQAAFLQELAKNMPIVVGMALLSGLVVIPLTNAAVVHAVAKLYLGRQVTAGEAISTAFSRLFALLGVSILTGLAVFVGIILCVIPGIIFAFWFALATHVVVIENLGGTVAMGRSKSLVSGNISTLFVLGVILFVIAFGVQFGLGFIPQPHLRAVVQIFIQAAMTILSAAAMVVFYFSCRCGHENFDLELLATSMGESVDDSSASSNFYGGKDEFE